MLADTGEKKVMAWMGRVAPNFEPDGVAERETVWMQTKKKWLGRWRKLGMLVMTLEGLIRIRKVLEKPEFSIMAVIQYCAHGNWLDLIKGFNRPT